MFSATMQYPQLHYGYLRRMKVSSKINNKFTVKALLLITTYDVPNHYLSL